MYLNSNVETHMAFKLEKLELIQKGKGMPMTISRIKIQQECQSLNPKRLGSAT